MSTPLNYQPSPRASQIEIMAGVMHITSLRTNCNLTFNENEDPLGPNDFLARMPRKNTNQQQKN